MKMAPKSIRLKDLGFLNQQSCKIKHPQKVEQVLNELIAGGPSKLQVVSDFDHTITKQRTSNGTACATSFEIFTSLKSLPPNYISESNKLRSKYYPIEIDPRIPLSDKKQFMIEWWTKTNDILVGFPFDEKELDDVAYKYKDYLRDRCGEFFEMLDKMEVPVLVFSAGLGHSVESVLRQANVNYDRVRIVSNFLETRNGLVNGFKPPIIHTYNKNENVLKESEESLVHDRNNIILMGDSLADADMANGVPSTSNIIKIGFLYHHIGENLDKYMDTFDIVLIDDQTMDVPIGLVKLIEN